MIGVYATETITWVKCQGIDQWNQPLPVIEEEIKGQVDVRDRVVRKSNGEEVISTTRVRLRNRPNEQDNLIFRGKSHIILNIIERSAFGHTYYYEVDVL